MHRPLAGSERNPTRTRASCAAARDTVLLSIAAIPKPMTGDAAVAQGNAIRSWARLAPHVEIFLFGNGDDASLAALAQETSAVFLPVTTNELGTPRLQPAWSRFRQLARGQVLAWINSDIIVDTALAEVARDLIDSAPHSFLAIGQRTEYTVAGPVDFDDHGAVNRLMTEARQRGRIASAVCKDYFLFSPDLFAADEVPDFLVGRGNWDNWMVARAHQRGAAVIDVSGMLLAIHQSHPYRHVPGGRRAAYVTGPEARYNQRLAGGRRLLSGSRTTWKLTTEGLKRRRFSWISLVRDVPRFLRLLRDLLFLGYFSALPALHYLAAGTAQLAGVTITITLLFGNCR